MDDAAYIAEVRASGQGKSEDYARFSDAEILGWKKYYQGGGKFKNDYGDVVDKPDERGANTPANMNGTGDQGDYGQGWNGQGGAGGGGGGGGAAYGGAGGVPQFDWTRFQAPSYESAMQDPGYQFARKQGEDTLTNSALAKGLGRTTGTVKELIGYNQDAAATQYGNVFNRALQGWGANFQGEQAQFAPQMQGWQTQYAGDLSKWGTQYGGDLAKYLNRENNVYGLLNQPAPTY